MTDNSQNNKRIAKNTILLYFRMFLMMGITLYTSRLILKALGADDFGIYNIVGGVVVLFGFINTAMTSATQRFLNFALGLEDKNEVSKTFSVAFTSHVIIALVLLLLFETIGLWFLNSYINLPSDRIYAANVVYQFSIITLCVNFIKVPYNALIIAHERMSFYAYISLLEAILKLLIVYFLYFFMLDKLILYSGLVFLVSLLILFVFILFCFYKYKESKVQFYRDKKAYGKLFSFSSWSLLGGIAGTATQHGTSVVLNMFYGVLINTALGIANQVSFAIYTFASNFQVAFTPQLTKYYAKGDIGQMKSLIYSTSKYSFYLFLFVALPLSYPLEKILIMWLDEIPIYTVVFTKLILITLAIETMSAPLWLSTQAIGNIKTYQIITSIILILNLPISYFLLELDYIPSTVFILRIAIAIVLLAFRVSYLHNRINLSYYTFICKVILPCLSVSIIAYFSNKFIYENLYVDCTPIKMVCFLFFALFNLVIVVYIIGVSKSEKVYINSLVKKIWLKMK